ncbi:MAG: hypothetical protein AAF216_13240 [Pseudomonadota bacterium]
MGWIQWRGALFAALFGLALACLTPEGAAQEVEPVEPATFEELHEAYLADTDLQLERPEAEPEPFEPPRSNRFAEAFADFLYMLGPLFRWLFWVIIIGLVGWLLWFLFGEAINARFDFRKKDKDEVIDSEVEDFRPDASAARSLLEEADALAREGRFAEAVHLLLFRSIEDIQTRKSGSVPRSLTAREIGGLKDLPDKVRAALSPIIGVVERSFFGGQPVDHGGWSTARQSYEDFAFGEAW